MRSILSCMAVDRRAWLAALLLVVPFGCSGPQTDADPELDLVTGPLGDAITDVRAACLDACAAEQACLGGGGVADATCRAACDARFAEDRFVDTPSARSCLFRERAEMSCFASLECEAMQAWFAAPDGVSVPCATADTAAVAACEDYPF